MTALDLKHSNLMSFPQPPTYSNLRLTVEEIPGEVALDCTFGVTCRVTNCCDDQIEPRLNVEAIDKSHAILITNEKSDSLGCVAPYQHTDFMITCHPRKEGLHPIPSLRITDLIRQTDYKFDEIAYVFVK